jgi:uncharacterized membrane protein
MNISLTSPLIYLLGFIGLAAIGILPIRSWQSLKNAFQSDLKTLSKKLLAMILLIASVCSVWAEVVIVSRIFRCLTGTYCGPGVGSGWIYLAMLGVVYLVFEIFSFAFQKFHYLAISKSR